MGEAEFNGRLNLREAVFNGKRITRTHFNRKSQVCNIELILMGEGSWIQQEKKDNHESFQWEISTGNHRKSQVYNIGLILMGD